MKRQLENKFGTKSIVVTLLLLGLCIFVPFLMRDTVDSGDVVFTQEDIRELTEDRMQSRGITSQPIPQDFPAVDHQPKEQKTELKVNKSPQPIDPAAKAQLANHMLERLREIKERTETQTVADRQGLPRGSGTQTADPAYQKALDDLQDKLGSNARIDIDNVNNTLRYLRGDLAKLTAGSQEYQNAQQSGDFGAMASALLDEMNDVLNAGDPSRAFSAVDVKTDALGTTHITMQQQYNGIPVWGAELGVHYDVNGNPVEVSGVYAPEVNLPAEPYSLQRSDALTLARAAVNAKGDGLHAPVIEPIIYWDIDRAPRATYRVTLSPTMNQHWLVFVDSTDGSIAHIGTELCTQTALTASGVDLNGNTQPLSVLSQDSTFYMIDTSLPIYQTNSQPPSIRDTRGAVFILDQRHSSDPNPELFYVTSKALQSWDPTAVSVTHNFGLVEEYFRSTHSRNSIDDRNLNIIGIIHPGDPIDVDNAYWHPGPQWMVFGDGQEFFEDLPSSLDVAGHELTHGVISHSANLIYENQSGALNEHLADFFGAMIDRDDWQLGEGVMRFHEALRDMKNPHNPNIASQQPMNMSQFRNLPNTRDGDYGGVHINSGIPNHMSYLLAEGQDGIGRDDTEQILYRALTVYLRQRSQFLDYRRAAVSSAEDIFGANSTQVTAVHNAFDAVGITDDSTPAPAPPTEGTPTEGDDRLIVLEHVANTNDEFRQDYFYQILIQESGQTRLLVNELVARAKPAVSGDGSMILYVDAENNMKWTDGVTVETVSSAPGMINTIALSKNKRYFAYTTTDLVNEIVILDTEQNTVRTASLDITRTDGSISQLSYADFLTFNFRGDFLVYDALFEQQVGSIRNSDTFGVWGVYGLRMTDLVSQQLSPNRPGEQMGNPAIANLSAHNLLVDFFSSTGGANEINLASLNILENELNLLDGPLDFSSEPNFSGDDALAVYNVYLNDTFTSQIIASPFLDGKDSIDPAGTQLLLETQSILAFPVHFRVGEFTAQQGELSVPDSVTFGSVDIGDEQSQTIILTNVGNSDLEILDYSIEGENVSSFQTVGFNQTLPAGNSIVISTVFVPMQEGELTAELHILTTNADQLESIIQLQGTGLASSLPTNTPTPTLVPTFIPPTPTQASSTPTPQGPVSVDEPVPVLVYEFDQDTLAANGWGEVPGGFTGAPAGAVSVGSLPNDTINSSVDQRGLVISVDPGEVAFAYALNAIETNGSPVLLRALVRSDNPNVAIAVAGLKGDLAVGRADGSIGTVIPFQADRFVEQERYMLMMYEPDQDETVTPILQVASNAESGSANVYFDKLEVFVIGSGDMIPGDLFQAEVDGFSAPSVSVSEADSVFEFNQGDLSLDGWSALGGGFTGASSGENFYWDFSFEFDNSVDATGIVMGLAANQVMLLHTKQAIETNGNPVLLRLNYSVDPSNGDASVILGALQGDLNTGTFLDSSIATHQSQTSQFVMGANRWMTLVYQPNNGTIITPVVQGARLDALDASIFVNVDRVEVYQLESDKSYPGSLFVSGD